MAAVETDRSHHAVEELAGAADEGQAFDVLLAPGRLADEHHLRLRIAGGEHQLLCGLAQPAALEPVEQGAQVVEAGGAFRQLPRRHDGCVRRWRGIGDRLRGKCRARVRSATTRKQRQAGGPCRCNLCIGGGSRRLIERRRCLGLRTEGGSRIAGKAIHRLFLQHGIDARLHIEGEDRAQFGRVGISWGGDLARFLHPKSPPATCAVIAGIRQTWKNAT